MRRQFRTSAVLASLAVLVEAGVSRAQRPVAIIATPATVDSISARLVELELQRVSPNSVSRVQAESASTLSAEISALHVRLRALPNGVAVDSAAQERVKLALNARAATLGGVIESARLYYRDEYPPLRQALDEKRLITERLAEISKR